MVRIVSSVLVGVVLWVALVIGIDAVMSHFWPVYQTAKPVYDFTLPMLFARLIESTVALIIASFVTARVAEGRTAASWAFGILMLAFFIPVHYTLWHKFPIWYHAYFLASLLLIPVVVAMLFRKRAS